MNNINSIIIFLSCIFLILIFGKFLIFPLKKLLVLLINSALGALLIYIINLIGSNFGFSIGLNVVTSIVVGILGIPGVILLIVLKLFGI